MKVETLQLRNFRNYENTSVAFSPDLNVITGHNAQGKTNLLESLVYLSLTRSHRIADEKKLIRNDMPFADIRCRIDDEGIKKDLRAIIHPNGKTLRIDQIPVKKSSDFIGAVNVILFSPDDLYIFSDHPQTRRKIMDQEITKVSPGYLTSLNKYRNLMKERNDLLKNMNIDMRYLDILDEQMADLMEAVIAKRQKFIETVNLHMPQIYRELSMDETVTVNVRYKKCCMEADREHLLQMMKDSRQRDIDYRITNNGIHREDLLFEMNDVSLIQQASQGQKRMTMLAFKMALMKYIQAETGKQPVLLLDDVLSELDAERQRRLLEMIRGRCQCIITAAEIPAHMKNLAWTGFYVEQGRITAEKQGGSI